MKVRICGIIKYRDGGHFYVDLIVQSDRQQGNKRHQFGVDVEPNRGKIITYLSEEYGCLPSEVGWPVHIELPFKVLNKDRPL